MELMALTGLITAFGALAAWATRPPNAARASAIRDNLRVRDLVPAGRGWPARRPHRRRGTIGGADSLASALLLLGVALLAL